MVAQGPLVCYTPEFIPSIAICVSKLNELTIESQYKQRLIAMVMHTFKYSCT